MRRFSLHLSFWLCAAISAFANASEPSPNDITPVKLDTFKAIPVYHHGRVMPMDTLSKVAIEKVCEGGSRVKLGLSDYYTPEELKTMSALKPALEIFPGGEMRRMSANEVLLSWLVEPKKWERVPFIYAAHGNLHKALGLESKTATGMHRKFVSPHQLANSPELVEYMADHRDRVRSKRSAGAEFKPTETDEMMQELLQRYAVFRKLSHDPRLPLVTTENPQPGDRSEFLARLKDALDVIETPDDRKQTFGELLGHFVQVSESRGFDVEIATAARRELQAMNAVRLMATRFFPEEITTDDEEASATQPTDPVTLAEAEQAVVELREATNELATQLDKQKQTLFSPDRALTPSQERELRPLFRSASAKAADLVRLTRQLHLALYDNGSGPADGDEFRYGASVYVVPALNPAALERERDEANGAEPWLSLKTVAYGSDKLLHNESWPRESYDRKDVQAVQSAWNQLSEAFTDRDAPNRAKLVANAEERLARNLRTLGEGVEAKRLALLDAELPEDRQDKAMITYTEYPAADRLDAELTYNRLKPFTWCWVICLLSVGAFSLSFGSLKRPMFWTGVAILTFAIGWSIYGMYLRVAVTQWAPVTNMYETVIFVPSVIAIFAVWFVMVPLIWAGIRNAWRITAIPGTWEATPLSEEQRRLIDAPTWTIGSAIVTVLRFGLMGVVLWQLTMVPYSDGGRPVFSIFALPETRDFNGIGVWLLSVVFVASLVWFLPRVLLMMLASLAFVPWTLATGGNFRRWLPEVYPRWIFGFSGALAACGLFMVASYATVFDEDFRPLQPVLRSNFWLTIHVLTIVASYSAGLLAWSLGNVGLFHYLFGKYRDPVVAKNVPEGMQPAGQANTPQSMAKLPPEACSTLANYAYRCVQIAVVLLAAGTILGGLWADRSWGRFWGWDPKEVWALISLLVYLAVLHGRYAGWFNNFGMIVGTIFGAMMIAGSWYGVNFILPMVAPDGTAGLHSYGAGSGGAMYVFLFIGLNTLFLIAASIRYVLATRTTVAPIEHTPELFQTDVPADARPQGT